VKGFAIASASFVKIRIHPKSVFASFTATHRNKIFTAEYKELIRVRPRINAQGRLKLKKETFARPIIPSRDVKRLGGKTAKNISMRILDEDKDRSLVPRSGVHGVDADTVHFRAVQ